MHELLYQLHSNRSNVITQLFEKQLGISLTLSNSSVFTTKITLYPIAVQEKLRIDQAALTRHFDTDEGYSQS